MDKRRFSIPGGAFANERFQGRAHSRFDCHFNDRSLAAFERQDEVRHTRVSKAGLDFGNGERLTEGACGFRDERGDHSLATIEKVGKAAGAIVLKRSRGATRAEGRKHGKQVRISHEVSIRWAVVSCQSNLSFVQKEGKPDLAKESAPCASCRAWPSKCDPVPSVHEEMRYSSEIRFYPLIRGYPYSPEYNEIDSRCVVRAHEACPRVALDAITARNVLYIEDNPVNATLIQRIMARVPGVSLRIAQTGREGLEIALRDHPELVLLDLHLPDMKGEDILILLREDDVMRLRPIVILTADAAALTQARMRMLGATATLTKPVQVDEVIATLQLAVNGEAAT